MLHYLDHVLIRLVHFDAVPVFLVSLIVDFVKAPKFDSQDQSHFEVDLTITRLEVFKLLHHKCYGKWQGYVAVFHFPDLGIPGSMPLFTTHFFFSKLIITPLYLVISDR